jgi:hypothetical protein
MEDKRPSTLSSRRRLDAPRRHQLPEKKTMAAFISLLNFTDQGIKNVKESPDRFDAFRAMADEGGGDSQERALHGRELWHGCRYRGS